MTGFEHGALQDASSLFSTVTAGSEAPAIETSVVRNGSASLKIAKPSGTSSNYVGQASGGTVAVYRFAVRFAAAPASTIGFQAVSTADGAPGSLQLQYNPASSRFESRIGATVLAGTTPVAPGQWYVVDARFDVTSGTRSVEWRINGVSQPTNTLAIAASTISEIRFGGTSSGDVFTAYYDDLALSTTMADYPIGDGRILALRPAAAGAHDTPGDFGDDDGSAIDASSWQRVDDDPASSLADFVQQQTASGTSYLEWSLQDATDTARAVRAVVQYHSSGTIANSAATHIIGTSTADQAFQAGSMAQVTAGYGAAMVTPPGGGFTAAELSSLRIRTGYRTGAGSTPYWDAVLVEVEYPNGPPQSLSIRVDAYDQDGSGPHTAPATSAFGTMLPGSTAYLESRVTVSTEASNGYTLSAYDSDANGALFSPAAASSIPWTATGTVPAPSAWAGTGVGISAFGGSQTPARWCTGGQVNCTVIDDADLLWAPLTGSAQSIASMNAATSGDTTRVPIRMSLPTNQAPGAYAGYVTFTATASP